MLSLTNLVGVNLVQLIPTSIRKVHMVSKKKKKNKVRCATILHLTFLLSYDFSPSY